VGLIAGAILFCNLVKPTSVQVNLAMVDYRFNPDHLTFQHDVRSGYNMENHGKETTKSRADIFCHRHDRKSGSLNREHTEVVMQPAT